MDSAKVAGYVGAAIAVGFGIALIWFPPISLAGQAATVGAGFAFVTGGLAAVGVTVTVPAITKTAHEQGRLAGHREAAARSAPPRG